MQANLTRGNEYTIDNELQADCFAGAYSQYAQVKSVRVLLEEGDIDEGATAIFLVGDPEGTPWFDENAHGTGQQRLAAFKHGLENGYEVCLSGGLR
jgi:predicted metalloprotease